MNHIGSTYNQSVRQFIHAADVVLIVTTPEPTSIADAYATVKILSTGHVPHLEALVNQTDSPRQAHAIIESLQKTARLFLRTSVSSAGSIPLDRQVPAAVARRLPYLIFSPHCPATRATKQLAQRMRSLAQSHTQRGDFFPRVRQRSSGKAA